MCLFLSMIALSMTLKAILNFAMSSLAGNSVNRSAGKSPKYSWKGASTYMHLMYLEQNNY